MLLGIKVDKAVIKAKEKKQIDNIIVCVYNGELDKNGLFDSIYELLKLYSKGSAYMINITGYFG